MESNYLHSPDFDIDIDYDIEMKKELMDGEIQHSLVWKECFGDKEKESSLGYRAEIDANLNRAGKRRDRENEDYLIKQPVQIDMKKDIKLDPVETAEEFNSNADPLLDLETIRPHGSKNEGTIIMKDENVLQSNNSSNEEIELEAEKARNESASDSGLEDDADSSDEEYVPSSVWQKQKKSKRKDKPKSVECTVCDYSCSEPSRLLRHMRSHTKEKNYLCTLCDFKCYQSADLRLHLRTHTREKLFHCEFCDYSTGLNKNLVRHVKIHTDDKRHACSICDYSSIEAADLRAHMYKHSGLKPFSCKLCDYRGAKSSDLVKHVRIHTGERPYRCTQCDYCAARSYHLKIHLARHAAKSKSSKNRKK